MTKRTLSEPPRNSDWLEYHAEMTENNAYFVSGAGFKPFYTRETFEDLERFASDKPYVKIVNCDWTSEKWQEIPYYWTLGRAGYSEYYAFSHTKAPNHHTFALMGVKDDEQWLEKRFEDSAGDSGYTSFKWFADGHCFVIHRGVGYTRYPSGDWYVSGAKESIKLDGIPSGQLVPQARRMKAEKWGGFYDDIVEFLIDDGMDERFL